MLILPIKKKWLEHMDVAQKEEVFAAVLFYEYVSEKDEEFLKAHNYSREEALDGINMLAEKKGYGQISEIFKGM